MRFWRVARVPSRQKAPSLGPEKSTASLDQEWRLLQLGCSPTCLMRRPGLLNRLNLSRLEGRHGRAEKNLTPPQSRKPTSIDWAVRKSVMATRTVPGSPWGTRGLSGGSNARGLTAFGASAETGSAIPDWAIEQPSKYGINSPGLHETFSAHDCPWPFAATLTSLRYSSICLLPP